MQNEWTRTMSGLQRRAGCGVSAREDSKPKTGSAKQSTAQNRRMAPKKTIFRAR